MTVHEAWGTRRPVAAGRPSGGERVRLVAGWLERMLVGPAPVDDGADTAWDVEPFPGPPAGSGHVRLLPAGSTDRPVVGASARH